MLLNINTNKKKQQKERFFLNYSAETYVRKFNDFYLFNLKKNYL